MYRRRKLRTWACVCALAVLMCTLAHVCLCDKEDCSVCAFTDRALCLCALALFCAAPSAGGSVCLRLCAHRVYACALFTPSVYKYTCLRC
ncbi:MAG: hypothetical protein IKR85_10830 [Clostridia bacterium]|nr:hypothetical protein [Clostridia bacterium]